ncbi:MAG TPA: alpha/beta-type small acid-soluble spore protein [Firmicutes bacterium]|jgi:hypothetical protein|nr:alpha/beta-type small acid-soluble spore protein [Bacillota bacterium]
MARGSDRGNRALVPSASRALDQFKYEIANELGLGPQIADGDWGDIPSRLNGKVGGQMVRRMIELAERQMASGTGGGSIGGGGGTSGSF